MTRTLSDQFPPHRPSGRQRWILVAAATASVAITTAACGSSARSGPQQSVDYLIAGLRAQTQGRNSEAGSDYQKAIAADNKNKVAYYDLGLIQQLSGDLANAEKNYRVALQIDPDFTVALFNLAIIRTVPAPAEAVTLYRHVILNTPNDAGPHLNLGLLLLSLGQNAEANTELQKAVQLNPALAGRIPPAASPSPAGHSSPHP
jgi:tetratricopeptide (TPR) repeat protein